MERKENTMTMVTIDKQIRKGTLTFSALGHADPDSDGPNIVCAAISMLSYTLLQRCLNLQEEGLLKSLDHEFESGEARITAEAKGRGKKQLISACDTVLSGFALLQDDYPEQIEIVCIPKDETKKEHKSHFRFWENRLQSIH